jgi:hypothetical protein
VAPLQKVAMGLVVVVLGARFGGVDALPDPLGWLLVVAGLLPLRRDVPLDGWLVALAALAGLVSVPLVLPGVRDGLDPSTGWALSLPQTVFCAVLCGSLGVAAARAGDRRTGRLGVLRWAFVVAGLGPVLVYGGGLGGLVAPLAVLVVLAEVVLVWTLFAVSRRPWAGG